MPHVIKKPVESSPGIVVFTHKEWPFVNQVLWALKGLRQRIKSKYFVGAHWACHLENVVSKSQDFNLASKGMLTFKNEKEANVIELSSRNFIQHYFQKKSCHKQWDIMNVSRPKNFKRLPEFLKCIRLLYDKKKFYKVLLICGSSKQFSKSRSFDVDIYEQYLKMFSLEEREHFTFLFLRPDGHPRQIPSETIAFFMNSSRLFTLFSKSEGPNRSIHEALLSGLPILVYENLKGGGRYYLNESNSELFSDTEDAANKIIKILENYDDYQYDTLPYEKELSETYSKENLLAEFKRLFSEKNVPMIGDCNLEKLSFGLSAHIFTVPRWMRQPETNDLNSVFAAYAYLKQLLKD